MAHPAKCHRHNMSWHGLQMVLKQDTPYIQVINDDEGRLSKSGHSSMANNTKNYQNKAVDIWTELLDEGNLTNCPSLSIGNCCLGISSLLL